MNAFMVCCNIRIKNQQIKNKASHEQKNFWWCPRWFPASPTFFKLNVDAACDYKRGVVGLGAIVRNDKGLQVGALTHTIKGSIPVQSSEALAVLFGMRFCLMEGYKKVVMESDSINVVTAIHSLDEDLSREGAVLDEIRQLGQAFEEISWRKISRQANMAAHCLAKEARRSNGIKFWKEVGPPWLNDVVVADLLR